MGIVPSDTLALVDRRLAWLEQARPDLRSAVRLQGALLRETLVAPRDVEIYGFPLSRERARGKLGSGIPLLHDEPVVVDADFVVDLFRRLAGVAAARAERPTRRRLRKLETALRSGSLDPGQLATEAFVQHRVHLCRLADDASLDAEALANLALLAARPVLRAYADRLGPLLDEQVDAVEPRWGRGYCPVCGAWPGLAELRGVDQHRRLRCLTCGTGWRSPRPFCPFCEHRELESVRILEVAAEPRFAVEVCQHCTGYLKVARALEATPPALVGFDDLASMQLDRVAMEQGYRRPAAPGFALELALPEDEWADDVAWLDPD